MPDSWSRRTLLATLGATAVAGCTGRSSDSTPTPPAFPQGTPDPPERLRSAWPVPGAEPGRGNYAPTATGPTDPVAPLWATDLGAAASPPVVADGTLFVGAEDAVAALDARTGDELWTEPVPGTPATPWVLGDSVYVPTTDALVALSTADGRVNWTASLPSLEAMLATGHGVYALVDVDAPASNPATVVAFDPDGTERWRTDISRPWTPHLFASPDSVFVSSGGSGVYPWRLAADTGAFVGRRPTPVTDSPNPRFYRDGTVYSRDFLPAAVDARPAPGSDDGADWRERISVTALGPLSAGSDHVYCLAPGTSVDPNPDEPDDGPGLYALELLDGARSWSTTDTDTETAGRPVVTAETVLVPTADLLHCFAPADGTERWAVPTDGLDDATLAVADDIVYAAVDGTVRAYRPP